MTEKQVQQWDQENPKPQAESNYSIITGEC